MAAAAFLTAAEDELSCPICLELFVEPNSPKDLPGCDHVVCEVCLKRIEKTVTGRKRIIKCPECRKDIDLPKGGVEALRTNRKVRNLAEKHPKDMKAENSEDQSKPKEDGSTLVHSEDVQTALSETKVKIEKCKSILQELRGVKDQVQEAQGTEELIITQCAEEHINHVQATMQTLKTELQSAGEEKGRKIENEISALELQIQKAETDCEVVSDALNSGENNDQDIDYNALNARLTSITIEIPQMTFSGQAAAVFEREPNEQEINLGKLVHEVPARPSTPEVRTPTTQPVAEVPSKQPLSTKLIQTLDGFESTRITWSPKDWLVVSEGRKRQIVLCQKQRGIFKQQKRWKVVCSFQPGGIAVSGDGNQIFVALWADVWVYSPTGKILRKFKGTQNGVYCMKVTTTDRILIGYYHGNLITEHNSRGDVIRTIKTNVKPYYMTLIRDHGNTHIAMSDFEKGKVNVIRNTINAQQTLDINIPEVRGICYDDATESLLAITRNGSCVDQFCITTGRFVARVLEGLSSAWDLSLSSDKILAVSLGECIKLYQIV